MNSRKDLLWVISLISIVIIAIPIALILVYGFIDYGSLNGLGFTLAKSIGLTLFTSSVAAVLVFVVFTPLSYELARGFHKGLETVADIPASIPHPVVGIAFLILGSPLTPSGRFLASIGLNFFDTIQGMVLAQEFE